MPDPRGYSAQRSEAARDWARDTAHRANNLLTLLFGNADILAAASTGHPDNTELCAEINTAASRLEELLRDSFGALGHSAPRREIHPWLKALDQGLTPLGLSAENQDVPVHARVAIGPACFPQLISALVNNAREAAGEAAPRVTTTLDPSQPTFIQLDIENTVPPGFVWPGDIVFEPFFSTKPGHHGLGLSYALGVARSHEGCLDVGPTPAGTIRARLVLPFE